MTAFKKYSVSAQFIPLGSFGPPFLFGLGLYLLWYLGDAIPIL
jgi:hypothetical protein